VVLVRHAEKQDGDDPELTGPGLLRAERLAAMLAELPVKAVFASQFRRTQATVAPICAARGLTPQIVPAGAAKALVQRLQGLDGAVAVVAAHSNTIPGLLAALGVDAEVTIEDEDYGNLLIIQRSPDGTQLLRLRF
jgi:phosphohistidine phosphatase SixA